MERHNQLLELGFTLDESHSINIYNHECGMWIADFALVQYSNKEWDNFIQEFHEANI